MLNTFPLFGLSFSLVTDEETLDMLTPFTKYIYYMVTSQTYYTKQDGRWGTVQKQKMLYVFTCTWASQFLSLLCLPKYQVIYNGYAHHVAV